MGGDERRRLRRIAAALVIVLPRCAALPHYATGRTPPRPGLHHGGPLGRHHPGPAKLPLRAVQAVRGGNGGGAERAAAQCEQRPGSAVCSHERSEVDGILISFAEPEPAPAPTRRPADAAWCWALIAGGATAVALLGLFGQESGPYLERVLQPWVLAFACTSRSVLVTTGFRVRCRRWLPPSCPCSVGG